jgi:hypothetical protein
MNGSLQKLLRLSVAAFLIAGVCNAADFSGDGFTITLPDGFTAPVKSSTNKEGIETTTWLSKVPATGEALVISISRMRAKITDPAKMMDSTRDSLLKSVNGTLESEDAIPGEIPARRLLFHSGTAAFLRSRLTVDGDRLYDVLYVGRSEAQRAVPAVAQIFDSFKITPPTAAPPSTPPPPAAPPH